MAFKQLHDDRRGDIIGQICHHLEGPASVFFPGKARDIHLQDILVDHGDVRIIGKGIRQNGDERLIDLHGDHASRPLRQILGQRADSRPDFQNTVLLSHTGRVHNRFQLIGIDQEILTVFFLKMKIIFPQDLQGTCGRSKFWHIYLHFLKGYQFQKISSRSCR